MENNGQTVSNSPHYVDPNYHNMNDKSFPPISVGDWMGTFLICCIPIVGFILLLVWAFSAEINPSKANWAKASLLWTIIITGISVLIFVIAFAIAGASIAELLEL